tara:strand:+ start:113 stop:499 length:387 start_codon:yes stop_codon:yes gene_type:complete
MSWYKILKDEDFLKSLEHKYKGMIGFLNGVVLIEPAPAAAMEYDEDEDAHIMTDERAFFMSFFMEARTPKGYRLAISIMETESDSYTGQISLQGRTIGVAPEHTDKEIDAWLLDTLRFCHHQTNTKGW